MRLTYRRLSRPLLVALLALFVVGCARQGAGDPAPPALPTAAPSAAPASPAGAAAPSAAPTSPAPTARAADKLPALDSGAWLTLGEGDFTTNGVPGRILYLPATQPVDAGFARNFAPAQIVVAEALVVIQISEGSPLIQLQAGRAGIVSDIALWSSSAEESAAAYLVAFDPGSSFLLSLLPIDDGGAPRRDPIPINWSPVSQAFRIPPLP